MHDVVITGVGACTPIGRTYEDCAAALVAGRSAIALEPAVEGRPPRVLSRLGVDLAAEFPASQSKTSDRASLMLMLASDRALADAGLAAGAFDPARCATFVGSAWGPVESQMLGNETFFLKNSLSAMTLLRVLPNAPASYVSMRHGLRGECATIAADGASCHSALGHALRAIRRGEADLAIAGAVEAPLSENCIRQFEAAGLVAPVDVDAPAAGFRPFDGERAGLVLGEGAVLFVLESEAHARARGARLLARLAGFGMVTDAVGLLDPGPRGPADAMRAALHDAGLHAADVDHVQADGGGTRDGDRAEAHALRELLGERRSAVPVGATKAIHGHLLGASGGLGVLAALVALREGTLAPTINLRRPDADDDLDHVGPVARRGVSVRTVLVNSLGFAGANASLVVRRAEA